MKLNSGIYLRISREEENMLSESNSIAGQRLIIHQYIEKHPELTIYNEWCDDGYSGINFDRPGFVSMLQSIECGEIQCVIVKDLSRFGRDYIQTGRYLQHIFPARGIRFIAVCDNYDSSSNGFMEDVLLVPMLNLVNDAYCHDISNKVRWQQAAKRQNGDYIGSFAVYGYRKNAVDKNKLEIDERAAMVVRWIYIERSGGSSPEKISKKLNNYKIPSPYQYKKINCSRYYTSFAGDADGKWSPLAVRRILQNRMYTGVMIQGKSRKVSYKVNRRYSVPENEWICVDNVVPAIVDIKLYEYVQSLKRPYCKSSVHASMQQANATKRGLL